MSQSSARVNYEKTEIYETLVDEYGIFESYIDFFVFAASVGYSFDEYVPGGDEGDNEILWMHINRKELYQVVAASIAYQHTDDPEVLMHPADQLPILARFAAGGAQIAAEEFGDVTGNPTDAVVNFLRSEHNEDRQDAEEEILTQIREGFDDSIFE
jgi:hypothetical protein